jgi:5'-nucleotidase
MKRLVPIFALVLLAGCTSSVTILHFTDYHSRATPFYARGEREAAGVARAFAYVEPLSGREDVIVLNGGDTMNLGAPPWSDRFRCVEWPWWNGIVDAMAYGNHDADYGPQAFSRCQASIDYPIFGANVVNGEGEPLFRHDGKPYFVLERAGRRIGLFAVVGPDFAALLKPATSPVERVGFSDRIETARAIVRALREDEKVDAVVLFGHAHNEDDEALARAVPGIDLVLGTHSHKASSLKRIEGTDTWMIASGQYLEHVSRVEIEFRAGRIRAIRGELVPMTATLPEHPRIAARVEELQASLESDPDYAALFEPFGVLKTDLSNEGVNDGQTDLGRFVMDLVRQVSGADIALSTSSSFRGGLPAGNVSDANLLDVLPYDNGVLVFEMRADEVAEILQRASSLRGSDSFVQLSGIALSAEVEGDRLWRVATTDYLARISPVWKDLFERRDAVPTGASVRSIVRDAIARTRD